MTSEKTPRGLRHEDYYLAHHKMALYANPQQHPAPPTQEAWQAAALILVAAQHDIARRDGVINTMRTRWWRQLGSCAIHQLRAQAQQRRLGGLRRAYQKAQQLVVREQQLENNEKTRMKWWRQLYSRHSATEQRRRFQALLSARQRTQQLRTKELRLETVDMAKAMERLQVQIRHQETELIQLRNRPIPSAQQGSLQHGEPAATVHLLSAQLIIEAERQRKQWQDKATRLEQRLKALQQEFDKEIEYGAKLQDNYGALIVKYNSLTAKRNSELQHSTELQEQIGNLHKELRRLEQKGAHVYRWRL